MKTRLSAWTSTPVSATPFCLGPPPAPLPPRHSPLSPAGSCPPGERRRAGRAAPPGKHPGLRVKEKGGWDFAEILWILFFSIYEDFSLTHYCSFHPNSMMSREGTACLTRFLLFPLSSLSVPVDSDDPSRVPRDTRLALLWSFPTTAGVPC